MLLTQRITLNEVESVVMASDHAQLLHHILFSDSFLLTQVVVILSKYHDTFVGLEDKTL